MSDKFGHEKSNRRDIATKISRYSALSKSQAQIERIKRNRTNLDQTRQKLSRKNETTRLFQITNCTKKKTDLLKVPLIDFIKVGGTNSSRLKIRLLTAQDVDEWLDIKEVDDSIAIYICLS